MIALHNAQISENPISHLYFQYTTHCAAAQARKPTNSQHIRACHFRALQDMLHGSAAAYHRQYRHPKMPLPKPAESAGPSPTPGLYGANIRFLRPRAINTM